MLTYRASTVCCRLYAAGSYAGSVYTYDEASGTKVAVMKCSGKGPGLSHGVTQVKFSPNGLYLFAGELPATLAPRPPLLHTVTADHRSVLCVGARRSGDIVCWDVRRPKKELGRVSRSLSTNQVRARTRVLGALLASAHTVQCGWFPTPLSASGLISTRPAPTLSRAVR